MAFAQYSFTTGSIISPDFAIPLGETILSVLI